MHQFAQIFSLWWTSSSNRFLLTSPSPVIYIQVHRKQIMGTCTNKQKLQTPCHWSHCSLTADYYLQLPYMSYNREPSCSYHQLHQKQIIGTPISKSCKPLIAKDDYKLIIDCCLEVPYISHNWYRPIFGSSMYLTTEVVNPLKLSNWCMSWRNFCNKKWMTYTLISSSRSIDCHWKKNSICLSSKVDFFAGGQLSKHHHLERSKG